MLSLTVALLVIAGTLLLGILGLAAKMNKYWKKRGVKGPKPLPFVGNTIDTLLNKKQLAEIYCDLYKEYAEEPYFGFYDNSAPVLVVKDVDYIEKILIKDFAHFADHSMDVPDEKTHPIDHYHLFSLTGPKWRAFRYKMSPLFTSGKLKQMHASCEILGDKLLALIEKLPKKEVELKTAMHLYTLDFVGLAVFGLNSCVLENPNCEYHKMGTDVFNFNYFNMMVLAFFPTLARKFGFSFNKKESVEFFTKVIEDAYNYRKENNIQRNDFVQMMFQLKEKGKIEIQKWDPNDDYLKEEDAPPTQSYELTDISIVAQAYAFMTTGLDAVSLTVQMGLYELAKNQDVQSKLREEILEQSKLHSGITYEALKNMTYLDNVLSEVLRLHPLSRTIMRVCTKEYTLPNGFTIKYGEVIHIPQLAIHMDPNYHSDPLEFRPERFQYPVRPGTYFPFGVGPRVCIAMRFAQLQVKTALALVLSKYIVRLNPKTETPLKHKPQSILLEPAQSIYFDLEEVK